MVSDEMVSEETGSAWAISRSLNQLCGQVVCLFPLNTPFTCSFGKEHMWLVPLETLWIKKDYCVTGQGWLPKGGNLGRISMHPPSYSTRRKATAQTFEVQNAEDMAGEKQMQQSDGTPFYNMQAIFNSKFPKGTLYIIRTQTIFIIIWRTTYSVLRLIFLKNHFSSRA